VTPLAAVISFVVWVLDMAVPMALHEKLNTIPGAMSVWEAEFG
jgi:hypothetical protein